MKRLEQALAAFVTRMVGFIAPIGLLDVLGPDPLTDLEESLEVFEPDELWAARRRHPAGRRHTICLPAAQLLDHQ